jgi:hypothetical protein
MILAFSLGAAIVTCYWVLVSWDYDEHTQYQLWLVVLCCVKNVAVVEGT